jgi:hypothetical protein
MTLSVTSVRDSENKPRASLCTVGNSPNKWVKSTLCDGDEGQPTSGQALGEEKQEGNMHYFVCNSPGDIWNRRMVNKLKCGEMDNHERNQLLRLHTLWINEIHFFNGTDTGPGLLWNSRSGCIIDEGHRADCGGIHPNVQRGDV